MQHGEAAEHVALQEEVDVLEGEAALVRRRWQWWLEQNSHLTALVDGAGGWGDVKDVPVERMAAQAMAELSAAASAVVARTGRVN